MLHQLFQISMDKSDSQISLVCLHYQSLALYRLMAHNPDCPQDRLCVSFPCSTVLISDNPQLPFPLIRLNPYEYSGEGGGGEMIGVRKACLQ